MISNIVSSEWLFENLNLPNLIILDATLAKPKGMDTGTPQNLQVKRAKIFDIDKKFSDTSIDLPHMMCDAEQFEKEARLLGIDNDSIVIIYDDHGVYSGPRAWWMLTSMGLENVAVLDGGLPNWLAKGYPTESKTSDHTESAGDFTPSFESHSFVDSEYVLHHLDDESVIVLDARSRGRFDALEPEPRAGLRGGHIPKSLSLPFSEVLENGFLKSEKELKSIFSQFDLENKKLVFSCGSGLTACIILLAAKVGGYNNLTVYDGSWSEWGQPSDLPVEA